MWAPLSSSNTVLIGEGFPGLILASQVGFTGGYGCSHIITEEEGKPYNVYKTAPFIPEDKNVVLLTDVVALGSTMHDTLKKLQLVCLIDDTRISAILSVFYRKPLGGDKSRIPKNIWKKFFPLNTDFPIELCGKTLNECMLCKHKIVEIINEDLA